MQEQDIAVPTGPVRVKQRTLTATTTALASAQSHGDVPMHDANACTAPLPSSTDHGSVPQGHPALAEQNSDNDSGSDAEALQGQGRFKKYEDTVMLTKAGRGYQPQGYWGPDDGTDPNDAAARSEWQQVDMDGKVLQVAGTHAVPAASAPAAAAAATAAPHPALAPGGWGDDDEGGFGPDQCTPEYTWSAIGDRSEWQQAQRVLRNGAKASDDSSAPASHHGRCSSSSRRVESAGAMQVHEDTELLPQHAGGQGQGAGNDPESAQRLSSVAPRARPSMFAVHEDTELLPQHPALAPARSETVVVREDTECVTNTRPGMRSTQAGTAEVCADIELLGERSRSNAGRPSNARPSGAAQRSKPAQHPALAASASEAFMVHEDTEVMTQRTAVQRTSVFEQQGPARFSTAFTVREDTEILAPGQTGNLGPTQPCGGDDFAIYEDTELLGTRSAVPSTRRQSRAAGSKKPSTQRQSSASAHPALRQQESEFDIHQDTELVTQQPAARGATQTIGVHEDTELLTGNLQRPKGSIPADPERVTAPLRADGTQSQVCHVVSLCYGHLQELLRNETLPLPQAIL